MILFETGLAALQEHVTELDEKSMQTAAALFEKLKQMKNPRYRDYLEFWLSVQEEWYFCKYYIYHGDDVLEINNDISYYQPKDRKKDPDKEYDANEVLNLLIQAADSLLEIVKAAKYEEEVLEKLPKTCLRGVLSESDLPQGMTIDVPVSARHLKKEQYAEFCDKKNGSYKIKTDPIHFRDMTFAKYYHIFALGLKECGIENVDELTDKQVYFKYFASDERFAIADEDQESPGAFSAWYNQRCRGGNVYYTFKDKGRLPITMLICQDEVGYFFSLECEDISQLDMVICFYNAMNRAEYPVWLQSGHRLAQWASGLKFVGVVPEYISDKDKNSYFNAGLFIGAAVRCADLDEKLLPHVTWGSEEKVVLRE